MLTSALLLSAARCASAQGPDSLWIRAFGGASSDYGYCIREISPGGGYIIAGSTYSTGAGNYDIYLVKTDSEGEALWSRTYGGANADHGRWVEQTRDGGFIIAGYTASSGAGGNDFVLVKTDSSGASDWAYTYGGTLDDRGRFVQQTVPDSGYVIAGYTDSFGHGGGDAYLIKTDADGGLEWARPYGGTGWDEAWCVRQTFPDSGYVIAGATGSFGAGADDVYLVKANRSGYSVWEKTYGGTSADYGRYVSQTPADSGYVIAGYTRSFGAGDDDVYLIKTAANGDTLWTSTYGGANTDQGYSVERTVPDNGYILAGTTRSFGAGNFDAYVIRTDGQGSPLWSSTFGGSAYDDGSATQQVPADSAYVIVGSTRSFGAGIYDVFLVKTEPVMAGVPKVASVSDMLLASRWGPNPFREDTIIEYHLVERSRVRVAVYNMLGQEIRTLVDADQAQGTHSLRWDGKDNHGRDVSSGLYMARIDAGCRSASAKLLLAR